MKYPTSVKANGKIYPLNTDFRVAIRCNEVFMDNTIHEMEKMLAKESAENNYKYKVNSYVIDITYSRFNKVDIISVPTEVIESAGQNIDKTPSNETLKQYLKNVDLKSIGLDVEDMDNWTEEDWQDAKDALYEFYGINSDE